MAYTAGRTFGWSRHGKLDVRTFAPEGAQYSAVASSEAAEFRTDGLRSGLYLVTVTAGNGTDKPVRIDAVDVVVCDNDTDQTIAAGKVILEEELVIPVSDIDYYAFYISPEHIMVDGDTRLPETCSFDIRIDSTPTIIE